MKPGSHLKKILFTACGLSVGEKVYWYDTKAGKSKPVFNQTDLGTALGTAGLGCVTVTVTDKTSPTIAQLYGTVFAILKVTHLELGAVLVTKTGGHRAGLGAELRGAAPEERQQLGWCDRRRRTSTSGGYWTVTSEGVVSALGNAKKHGDLSTIHVRPVEPIIKIVPTADDGGYWLFGQDGGVFAFGDTKNYGSLPGKKIVPATGIVSAAVTPDGKGYWLTDLTGGVFAFGDAKNYGGFTSRELLPFAVIGMSRTGDGKGYWLVTTYGGVYGFGDAKNLGSLAAQHKVPAANIVGISTTASGNGYSLVGADGAIYGFGDAKTFAAPKTANRYVAVTLAY